MAPALAPKQGFLSSDSGSGAGHFPFTAPTPAHFDLNFAGSCSAPAPFQTKICYTSKSLIFVYQKN